MSHEPWPTMGRGHKCSTPKAEQVMVSTIGHEGRCCADGTWCCCCIVMLGENVEGLRVESPLPRIVPPPVSVSKATALNLWHGRAESQSSSCIVD